MRSATNYFRVRRVNLKIVRDELRFRLRQQSNVEVHGSRCFRASCDYAIFSTFTS